MFDGDVDLVLGPGCPEDNGRRRAKLELVQSERTGRCPDGALCCLHPKRVTGTPAIEVELDPAGEMVLEQRQGIAGANASVVDAFGQADDIPREAVPAHVRALPEGPFVEEVSHRLVDR